MDGEQDGRHVRHAEVATRLGTLTLVARGDALTGLYFPGHRNMPDPETFGALADEGEDAVFGRAGNEIREYLRGERTAFDIALEPDGDSFRRAVWNILETVSYGSTTTYGAIAGALGRPAWAQRVGHAVAMNPISIIIPCHRVIGADGSLTGYAGGLERKRFLLDLEGPDAEREGRLF